MSYKLAIFDMDGTILDTLRDLTNGVNHALEQAGMPVRTEEYLRKVVGSGIITTLTRCAPEGVSAEEIEKLYAFFAPYYEKHRTDNTRPYPSVPELLKKLRAAGIKTAVVSNKSDVSVKPLCEMYFRGLFDMSVGTGPDVSKKPSPEMTERVIEYFGFNKSDTVYIGDSEIDVKTAENTGIDGIFVDWGFRSADLLKQAGAAVVLSDTESVYEIIVGSKRA